PSEVAHSGSRKGRHGCSTSPPLTTRWLSSSPDATLYESHSWSDSTAISRSLMGPYRAPATGEALETGPFCFRGSVARGKLCPIFGRPRYSERHPLTAG